MADRPVIFSGEMVRALLSGRKTQTRRLVTSPLRRCQPGDRLYVREAVSSGGWFSDVVEVRYRAHESASHTEFVEQVSVQAATSGLPSWPKYRPSIHMPRWASRVTLIVEAVRIETLNGISEADAEAEGVEMVARRNFAVGYALLWNTLHKRPGETWDDNPSVVALTFAVQRGNIDRVAA